MARIDRLIPQGVNAADHRLERLARMGYLTKGIVYALVGLLAAQAAFGAGGATTDTQGVLERIVTQPFGQILLGLTALGLAGYALWRVVQAALDPEHKGNDAGGLAERAGSLINGVIYFGLALTAGRMALGTGGAGGDGTEDITARLMGWPLGVWLVGIAGLVVIGVGVQQLYQGYRASFRKKLREEEMSAEEQTWAVRAGRFGLAARGIVFVIIGAFLIQAARSADPQQARGLGEALATLAEQPFGPLLLGTVALGLVAYGVYMAVLARYWRFPR
ncbi:MAG TPA: DUF1206 domain-containing protein [Roseiflexaceae bacterium]|nr:DUF1206 domain-containing protein [Roseiflexaceae bacterium]